MRTGGVCCRHEQPGLPRPYLGEERRELRRWRPDPHATKPVQRSGIVRSERRARSERGAWGGRRSRLYRRRQGRSHRDQQRWRRARDGVHHRGDGGCSNREDDRHSRQLKGVWGWRAPRRSSAASGSCPKCRDCGTRPHTPKLLRSSNRSALDPGRRKFWPTQSMKQIREPAFPSSETRNGRYTPMRLKICLGTDAGRRGGR